MTDQLLVVPKRDEVTAVLEVFGVSRDADPDDRLTNGVELWRTNVAGETTIALLDRQTNTNSGPLTMSVLHHENPGQIYLVGTALGNPDRAPLGSVFVARGVTDISERRPSSSDHYGWVPRGPYSSRELSAAAASYTLIRYTNESSRRRFYADLDVPEHLQGDLYGRTVHQIAEIPPVPIIAPEELLSGNEYMMVREGEEHALWQRYGSYRAYDMEAAAFLLSAESTGTPWLVVRAVSDYGSADTCIDRAYATTAAAQLVKQFLESGRHLPQQIRAPRPRFSGAALITQWGSEFRGYMGFRNDEGRVVIYEERGTLEKIGPLVTAKITSNVVVGDAKQPTLRYIIELSVAHGRFVAGTWINEQNSMPYFGSIAGEIYFDLGSLGGLWTGTHGEGIRVGRFTWYSLNSQAGAAVLGGEDQRTAALKEFTRLVELPQDGRGD